MKKKLKRLISILLSTALVFILLCNIFTAESKIIDISLSNIQITGDQQAVIMLNIDEGSYMGNGMFHITFNTAELRLISVDDGELAEKMMVESRINGNTVNIGAITVKPLAEGGNFVKLTFDVLNKNVGSSIPVTVRVSELYDGYYNTEIPYNEINGSIKIIDESASAPDTPAGLNSENVKDTYARINWSAVPNATGYNIYVNNKKVNELPISGTFYDLTSLDADSVNSIQATALNSRGESEKSKILDVKTTKLIPSGDVTLDGNVQLNDAVICLQHVAKLLTLNSQESYYADTDGDSAVTMSDAVKILQIVARID